MKLPFGKIPIDILKDTVLKNLGATRKEVIVGPQAGYDGAVIEVGDKALIVSMDPITGAVQRIGWLAVNINSNDVATFGIKPILFFSCILLPESADKNMIEIISKQMDKAARNLGISIAGGHCEVTPGLKKPIIIGCAMGIAEKEKYVIAGGAKAGDKIILTKSIGIEGTAILAIEKEQQLLKTLEPIVINNAKKFLDQISIVKEAMLAFKTGGTNAMHDPTEGGIAGGIHEMADASNLGVSIKETEICIRFETAQICEALKIDPLHLISSGSLLIASKPEFAEIIMDVLHSEKISARIIGEFLQDSNRRIIQGINKKIRKLVRPKKDALWNVITNSLVQIDTNLTEGVKSQLLE